MSTTPESIRPIVARGGDESRLVWWDEIGTHVKVIRTAEKMAVRWPCDVLGRPLENGWESWTFPTVEDAEAAFEKFEA